jgi:TetR/AcrR family transcriptional regulator, tetracycline repressor protein
MDNKRRHQLSADILEQKRRLINRRLDMQRARVNARFDQKKAQLTGELNAKQEQIINAALELLHEGGLSNLSLRDIARRINIQAPAIYWHFKSKEILVDYMAEVILQKAFAAIEDRRENETWQDWMMHQMKELRKAMLSYPDGARIVAGAHLYPAVTLGKLFEISFTSLSSAGIDQRTARHILFTCTSFAFGCVIEEQSSPTLDEVAAFESSDLSMQFPHMMRAVHEAQDQQETPEQTFIIGINLILKGSESITR